MNSEKFRKALTAKIGSVREYRIFEAKDVKGYYVETERSMDGKIAMRRYIERWLVTLCEDGKTWCGERIDWRIDWKNGKMESRRRHADDVFCVFF